MKSRPNPFALLLRLALVVEMVMGGAFYFPTTTLASAPEKMPSAPALQSDNHAPEVIDDAAHTDADTPVTIDVLANDDDADGDTLTVDSVTDPEHGAVINNGVNVTYTPNTNYCGSDRFTYIADDGNEVSQEAEVVVLVCGPNPNFAHATFTAFEDIAVDLDVYITTSPFLELPILDYLTTPQHGTITIANPPGPAWPFLTYKPDDGYCGPRLVFVCVCNAR